MPTQTPDPVITHLLFKAYYPLAIRLWHWLTFLLIAASLITVLLGSTMFRTRSNTDMVQKQVEEKGGMLTPQQARAVAHKYSDKLWNAHKYIGFGLCFALFSRIVIEIALSKEQKLSSKIRRALKHEWWIVHDRINQLHYIRVKWGYVIFYVLLFVMAATGLGLAFEDLDLFRTYHRPISNIHSFTQYLIYAYIFLHIGGVIRAEFTKNRGLVSAMINGGTKQAAD